VALTAESFQQPAGRLQAAWYPSDNLSTLLTAWLDEATANTVDVTAEDQEAAREAWVYYRAFQKLADDLLIEPASQTAGVRTSQFSDAQLSRWAGQASTYLSTYQSLTGAVVGSAFKAAF
jgi:hypothetical protein